MLIDILLKQGQIKQEQAIKLKEEIKKTLQTEEEILIKKKIIPEKDLFEIKGKLLKTPLVDLIEEDLSFEALKFIPKEMAIAYNILPISYNKNILEIGTPYPENFSTQQTLAFLARQRNLSTNVILITISDFQACLNKYQHFERQSKKTIEEIELISEEEDKEKFLMEIKETTGDAPIINLVSNILIDAIEKDATDIHIEPLKDRTRIRIRLDGILQDILSVPVNAHFAIIGRIKILARLKTDETRIPQDGRFSGKIKDKDVDFRVATLPTSLGEKIVIRILTPLMGKETGKLEQLGILKQYLPLIKESLVLPHGMILVTGPTGSGKTTTLYAFLSSLNKPGVNIITLEDPVEYKLEGINQSQIRPEIGYTFATGLRQILRQDPDIIMVGEIRDSETAGLAIQASLTGHLVFSTLHTNNAAGVIPRLIDLGVSSFLIPPSLNLIISQRLIRSLCLNCKIKKQAPIEHERIIQEELKKIPDIYKKEIKISSPLFLYYPQGCKRCINTGFKGRIGIFEIIKMTDNLKKLTLSQASESKIWEESEKQNMITVLQNGILQTINGVVSLEEVLRICRN